MMDSRKRPYSDDEDAATVKKRVLVGPNGTPHVNGVNEREPTENDSLELFRKEAIFRRMRHYSREHERSQTRIAELERRKHTCEAGLAAMSACWNQIVETIRLLVKPEDVVDVNRDLFDFTLQDHDDHGTDFRTTLEHNMNVTKNLVNKLVEAGGGEQRPFSSSSVLEECEKITTECVTLRSEVKVMRAKLRDSEEQRDRYHNILIATENRLDRSKSSSLLAIQARADNTQPPEVKEEFNEKRSSPESPRSPAPNNESCDPTELDILRGQILNRDVKIVELEKEAALLRDEKTLLESNINALPYETVSESPHFKALLTQASYLQHTLEESRHQVSCLNGEVRMLQSSRKDWEDDITARANQANQDLKSMLAKRDADNARLRDQRDQQGAELNERKQKDNVKFSSLQELKSLVDSRSERIVALESEIRRCKAQLAANANQEDLMLFLMEDKVQEIGYIDSLRNRITELDRRNAALEQTLSTFQGGNSNIAEHTEALQRRAEADSQLAKYRSIYGDFSAATPEVSQLSKQLQQKEDEIQKLRLLDVQRAQTETSLYAELDKLSAAWEALDRQVKNKVFDLVAMEDRLTKAGLDKAKSENKFYATMRDKEAIDVERKNALRNMEKQHKLVERLVDAEKNLTSQLNAAEKEIAQFKVLGNTYREKVDELQNEVTAWQTRAEGEKKRVGELCARFAEREKTIETRKVELSRLEDGVIRQRKELEQKRKELSVSQGGKDSSTEDLMALLKCSCRKNFRNTIITKCMHTFCKECVDARITTRQRKCPACGVAFSQGDVLNGMFFQ